MNTIHTQDGTSLYLNHQRIEPKGSGNSVCLIVHGLGEHSGRYTNFPKELAEAGGDFFSEYYFLDQRGHGRSGGPRGDAPTFETLTDDLESVVKRIREENPGHKLVIFAHSFGGLVVLYSLLKKRVSPDGVIISAPLLRIAFEVPKIKEVFGKLIKNVLPGIQLKNEVNPGHLSHDPEVAVQYIQDRLVHQKITPRLYFTMREAMDWIMTDPAAVKSGLGCPSLFLVPTEDKVVDATATLEFYRKLDDLSKNLREYPGFYHEAVNETEKQKVFGDMAKWLKSILKN
ncbi:MAG: lysophospholipase [Bacteriovoracia bacterium]